MISSLLNTLIYIVRNITVLFGFTKTPGSLRCLAGKTSIVTGGNSGIGFAVALKLASRGCRVILADCQNGEQSRDDIIAATGNRNIVYKYIDLSSLNSVRCFASDICRTEDKIDILVNNAGVAITEKTVSEDGLNYVMQVNIFGAFLLTHLLLDPMKKSGAAQVLFTSSIAVCLHSLTLERLNPTKFEMNAEYSISLYSNSKLCNILAAEEFGQRLQKYKITVNSIDPVGARTPIFNNIDDFNHSFLRIILKVGLLFIGKNIDEISSSYLYVLTKNEPNIPTGENYVLHSVGTKPKILENRQFCQDVWSKLEDLVQLTSEEKIDF